MEEEQYEEIEEAKTPLQHGLKFGLIIGMVGAIINILIYVVDPSYLANMWYGIIMLLVFLGLVIYGGISYRNEIGGYIDFGPAYIHGFTTFVIMGIIGLALNLLLHNVIDPNLGETLTDASIEQTTNMLESFGMSGDQLDEALEEQRGNMEAQFSNGGLIKGFFISLIVYAVIALITGLIVRRREKVSDVY